jgi:2-polyprenyl-3-methyl-5-hydroxy-6-metoxy-1,4-benzoquinol methylase
MDSRVGLPRLLYKVRRALLRDDPHYYDMYEETGEQRLGKLYLEQIQRTILSEKPGASLSILDAGCQAGRLAIPLALDGHRVTGVDTSGVGLRRAKRHAREKGARLSLVRSDLTRWLPAQAPEKFDAVVCTEVLYLRKNYLELLNGLIRLVKRGGLLFISHRPSGYYLAESFEHRDLESVRTLLTCPEGMILGSYYNWQDTLDLEALYQKLALKILKIVPVGELNPLPAPEELSQEGRVLLQQAQDDGRFANSGRYLLVCAKKAE